MRLYEEALQGVQALLEQAARLGLDYPTAMTLATVDEQHRPSARTVLLKGIDQGGFVFYTNQSSRKGAQLAANPRAALLFYWQALHRQVEIDGSIERVTDAEADEYWLTRPKESRIGAWASQQSQVLASRENLEKLYQRYAEQFGDGPIPRPPHWSGYRLLPERIEFWEERPFRLHLRTCYQKNQDGHWTVNLLNP
jgi:pyridoxamine 5'-phosphate oxidase